MKALRPLEQLLPWLCVFLPWAALGYGLRFTIGPIPSTFLEVYLFGFFFAFTASRGGRAWIEACRALPFRWLLAAWVGVGLLAAFWSPSVWAGLGLWRAYLLEPVLAIALVNLVLRDRPSRDRLRGSLWSVVVFVGVWVIGEFLTGKGIPSPWNVSIAAGRRATGPYGFPNAVALFVAPIVAYAGARAWLFRERFSGVAAAVGFLATLAARSDGGALAILAAWTLALFAGKRGRWLLAVAAGAAALGAFFFPGIAHSVWKELTFQGWSGVVRLYIWHETWDMLQAHWFLGAGLGGYPVIFDAFHKARAIEIFQYPHQFVLTAWSELGLPGLVLFLGLLAAWAKRAWASAGVWAGRVAGLAPLVAIVVHGLVDVPYWKNDLALIFFLLWWLAAWVDQPEPPALA